MDERSTTLSVGIDPGEILLIVEVVAPARSSLTGA
jgi:hypothetical protein